MSRILISSRILLLVHALTVKLVFDLFKKTCLISNDNLKMHYSINEQKVKENFRRDLFQTVFYLALLLSNYISEFIRLFFLNSLYKERIEKINKKGQRNKGGEFILIGKGRGDF